MKDEDELGIAGTSHLTDVDWAEINRLKRIHESGGGKSLKAALEQSRGDDPVRWTRIMAAFFPGRVRETIKDQMANAGIDVDDIREMLRKSESPAGDQ